MPELIDKKLAYAALKHEQYTHCLSFTAEAFEKAARIIDQMEERGIIGGYEGAKPRQVLITSEQLMEMRAGSED